jgi:hypothetical protein
MGSFAIVVVLEVLKLASEIAAAPEGDLVEKLAADRADQALDEWMR